MRSLNDMVLAYYNQNTGYRREPNRYSASEIYQIEKGYLNSENFFDKQEKDMKAIKNIFRGVACEEYLEKIFTDMGVELVKRENEPEKQVKYELNMGDYTLVVKPDFIFKDKDFVFETKAPNKIGKGIPIWYQYQCECEYRATNKQVYLVKINIYADNNEPLFVVEKYKPSDKRWEKIQNILSNFNKQMNEKYEKEKQSRLRIG